MINKNFEYYIGTTETAYVEDNISIKALDELKKEFGNSSSICEESFRFMYATRQKPYNEYAYWLLNTIHNEIFKKRSTFTEDFNIIELPSGIPETDSLKLISILRRAGISYGLTIRRLSSNSFLSQWKKHYLTTTNIRLKNIRGADQYRHDLRYEMQNEILKFIRPKLVNYSRDVWEIYYAEGLEDQERTDPAGKYGVKPSIAYAIPEEEIDNEEEYFDELSL